MPDAIVLVGLSGSGKSTVGRAVAERLGRPFLDLDALLEAEHGAPPATLIDRHGEAHFRQLEAAVVARACAVPGAVIATGGGAIIEPLNRWALWQTGPSIWLDAPDEVLLGRLAKDDAERPLLRGVPAAMAGLRAARADFYRAADVRIDATPPVPAALAEVLAALDSPALTTVGQPRARRLMDAEVTRDHPMGPPSARIVLGHGLDAPALRSILAGASVGVPLVVADRRAARALPGLIGALPSERRLLIGAGERHKRLRTAERLLEAASELGAERGDAWIGLGGGTTTDLVGTAAALYLRGAPFVALPTTWLGMADAAIGGKAAVDLSRAKNAAGAFWPPVAVVADTATLASLPRARRLDGMAECLKAGLIGDPALWDLVASRGRAAIRDDAAARYAIVERAVRLKLGVVARDPFERGERRTLNLGHTIGHALEVESGYRLAHGQAVVLGLRAVAAIAARRGAEPGLAERIDAVVSALGYQLRRDFDAAVVRAAMTRDKKRQRGRQRWILPLAVGRVSEVDDVDDTEVALALRTIAGPASGSLAA